MTGDPQPQKQDPAAGPPAHAPAAGPDPAAAAPIGGGPSPEARRLASTILEVLAGMRSITDAALLLGVSPARYHQLETRAVLGLIAACEPRPPGPVPGAGLPGDLERLKAERDRLQAEVGRYQALLRIAQNAFGATAETPPARTADLPGAAARRSARTPRPAPRQQPAKRAKRTPTVRAMRLAKRVREAGPQTPPDAGSTTPPPDGIPRPSAGG